MADIVFMVFKIGFILYIILTEKKNPKTVWAWILLLWIAPLAGGVLYLLTGQVVPKKLRRSEGKNVGLLTEDNRLEIFTSGKEKFEALQKDIKDAKKEIFLQYYIIKDDFLFGNLSELLIKKAREGVEVRILYDKLGSRKIQRRKWKLLAQEGICIRGFRAPFFRSFFLRFNYRNHRKIAVIDRYIGYLGGYNIGREYLGLEPRFGVWRDTHIKLTGSAVATLRCVFLQDWGEEAKEAVWEKGNHGCLIQMITSGPDSLAPHIRNSFLRLISLAEKSIWIQTPYFIPDDPVLTALKLALLAGKEVRLMIPCMPDHLLVYPATRAFAGELLEAGADVYIYEPGFLHAKGMIVDDKAYCYGTANMDIRSFHLNYEINAVVYDLEETRRMQEIFREDMKHCRQLTKEEYEKRSLSVRIKEQICKLFSPLL